jgi:hypothetical protein
VGIKLLLFKTAEEKHKKAVLLLRRNDHAEKDHQASKQGRRVTAGYVSVRTDGFCQSRMIVALLDITAHSIALLEFLETSFFDRREASEVLRHANQY